MANVGSDITIPAIIIGAFLLLREIKDTIQIIPPITIEPLVGYSGEEVDEMLLERTEDLQAYEAERLSDAQRIEAHRAVGGTIAGNYGTVIGSQGGFTGVWTSSADPNKCHVIYATPYSSNTSRFFTGAYCRAAKSQGLII